MRLALGILAGLVTGVVIIAVTESIGHLIFPPPDGVDLKSPEALKAIMKDIPLGAKVSVLVAWGLGALGGGLVGIKVARGAAIAAWIVAALLMAAGAFTMTQIPHPMWMMIGAVAVNIGGAFVATRLAGR